jgi:hypothetical protein
MILWKGKCLFKKNWHRLFSFCTLTLNRFFCRFTVEADKPIKDLTIITEYVGDVDFLKNREYDDGDSIMTLLTASNPSQSLVICPDKRSNIARFINGINNHTPYVSSIFKFYSLHMMVVALNNIMR